MISFTYFDKLTELQILIKSPYATIKKVQATTVWNNSAKLKRGRQKKSLSKTRGCQEKGASEKTRGYE